MRRLLSGATLALLALCPVVSQAQAPASPAAKPTDLDDFMARALLRRDIDRKTLSDYVLDEVEEFEVLGPGRVPFARMKREYTWYVRDGFHVRSPLRVDGVPIPEADRRAYEERWIHSEQKRREYREQRAEERKAEGKGPAMSVPSINEPRFISESYFMDFKFEPGNYYLAGKETVDGKEVLKIDYLPEKLFDDNDANDNEDAAIRKEKEKEKDREAKKTQAKKDKPRKEITIEVQIDRKMDKTSQITLWVDPVSHQIVKYTFDNVWMDFLPAGWLVRIDDLRANMQMGQPFPDVWLPKNINIHAGVTLALGPMELQYKRAFSNYRKADVKSKISIPKKETR